MCKEACPVNRPLILVLGALLLVRTPALSQEQSAAARPSDAKTLVFADFERVENNRPVSTRGGLIQLYGWEESKVHKSTFKGIEGSDPPAPELVRIKKDDANRAMKFDYVLVPPNQWAGVTVEIHGLPDVDGRGVPEDVSGFKTLSLQVYATGVPILRLEAVSGERGKDMAKVYPQTTFKVRPGFNTYKVPMTAFTQPEWVPTERRENPKDILKRLTSLNLSAFCDQCQAKWEGMVIVDNIVFEK
jgi:hypothetical protein